MYCTTSESRKLRWNMCKYMYSVDLTNNVPETFCDSETVFQSGRCQGICASNLGCFGSHIENNDCGVNCNVS